MISLTPAQHLMAWCIQDLTEVLDRAPTLGELAAEFDTGKNTVCRLLDTLADRGWMEKRRLYQPRGPIALLARVEPLPDSDLELMPSARVLRFEDDPRPVANRNL